MIGTTLAQYRILALLGAGGMGAVYRAHDTRLGRDVALKVLPPELLDDPLSRARLLREARTASQLNHPHICVIHEVGEAGGVLYIAMELIDGPALQAMIPPGGLPTADVLRYGTQIADALAHAHEHGVIHRDLKTANVVVARGGRARVLDFGIARTLTGSAGEAGAPAATLTGTGTLVGTPHAMAPETLRGERADARSDVWSLGVVLYEMSCGHMPFAGATLVELCSAILTRPLEPLPARVPPALRSLIERCLDKDPARRASDAAMVRAELEAIGAGTQPGHGRAGRRILLAAGLLSTLAAVVLVARDLIRDQKPDRQRATAAEPGALRGLAVLPLENLSADSAQLFFADGMTEELIGNLGQIGSLRVISRNSVMRYRNSTQPLEEIARELGVELVVTGSVRPAEDSVRVRAHLIQVRPERELWSAGYTREARQVLAMQSEVAQDIATRIAVRITPGEHERMTRATPAVDPEAYEHYLRGRFYWNQRTAEGMRRALVHFERALAIDPGLALAQAGLADAYGRLSLYAGRPPRETFPLARKAAEAALRLDDGLAEAHTSLAGVFLFYERDWARAKAEFRRAIELRPSYATAHHWYSIYLRDQGQFPEALAEAERARGLDPLSPIVKVNLADTHYYARHFDEAIRIHREVIASDSAFAPAHLYLGLAYAQAGRPADAVASIQRARALNGGGVYGLGALGYAEARAGHAAAARRARSELLKLAAGGLAVAFDVALIHVGLGETDAALEWLARAEEERASLNELAVDPKFDPLRSEPRFARLLDRLGLANGRGGMKETTAQNRK